jgi:hypothetical protein
LMARSYLTIDYRDHTGILYLALIIARFRLLH